VSNDSVTLPATAGNSVNLGHRASILFALRALYDDQRDILSPSWPDPRIKSEGRLVPAIHDLFSP
jgi:hypothetical protein